VLHNSKPSLLEAIFLTFIAKNSYKMGFLWAFYLKLATFLALAVIMQHSLNEELDKTQPQLFVHKHNTSSLIGELVSFISQKEMRLLCCLKSLIVLQSF
jgi:hypothetical protein